MVVDTEMAGHSPCLGNGVARAAGASLNGIIAWLQPKGDPNDFKSLLQEQSSRDAGIDPAAHCRDNAFPR
jgi:hypothetical protein